MTIDERLEALTHSVELLASMHKDNEKQVTGAIIDIRDAVMRLSVIAEAHQDTLDDHDERVGALEKKAS